MKNISFLKEIENLTILQIIEIVAIGFIFAYFAGHELGKTLYYLTH